MYQARNHTSGKVHLMHGKKTFCGLKNIDDSKSLEISVCEEIMPETICERCFAVYYKLGSASASGKKNAKE